MKIKITEPVRLDGKDLAPGTQIDVKNAIGQQILDAGSAELVGKQAAIPVPPPAPTPEPPPAPTPEPEGNKAEGQ